MPEISNKIKVNGGNLAEIGLRLHQDQVLHQRNSRPNETQFEADTELTTQTGSSIPLTMEFPAHIISGAAGRFAEALSEHLEPPIQFFYFSYLTCLGTILADRLTVESAIAPQPRLYTLLLGQSADDRKSTAIEQTIKFFRETNLEGFWTCYGTGSAEGLQKQLSKNKQLLLVFDEFKQFVSKCRIDTSVLLPCVNTLFESNRYESQTSKHSINIDDAHLSMLAASTVQTYESIFTSAFIDIGFNNRLFIVTGTGRRRFAIPRKIPNETIISLREDLQEVISNVSVVTEISIADDARELFEEWYTSLEQSVHAKRLDGYALRLASLLTVNDFKMCIDVDIIERAIALVDWQLQVRKLHDPIDADSVTARTEEKIRRVLDRFGSLKDRELQRKVNANRIGLFFYKRAIHNLLGDGQINHDSKNRIYSAAAG